MKVEKEREEDEKKGQKGRRKGSGKVTSADNPSTRELPPLLLCGETSFSC